MTRTSTSNRSSHAVYVIEGKGENAFWTRIGAAWADEDGDGSNLQLSCLPLSGRLVVRKPRPKADGEAAQ